jgi:hypothetical protein
MVIKKKKIIRIKKNSDLVTAKKIIVKRGEKNESRNKYSIL